MYKVRVLELFAGIGSWHKSLDNLRISHEIVDAVEIDKGTMKSYNLIHNSKFVARDIKYVNENSYSNIDMICYSPPCQSWSKGGKQGGFKDDRGRLFYESLRIIKKTKPVFAVMENVKNLVSKRFKDDFDIMLDELDKAGYNNYWQVINSLDVNHPQHRERVFVVSVRKDVDIRFAFPDKVELTTSFVDLLETDWDKSYLHSEKGIAYMDRVTTKGRTHWDFGHHNDTNDSFSYCVTKNFDKGVPYNVLVDRRNGHDVRKHTPLEVTRLMGFDDEDYLSLKRGRTSDSMVYKVMGNSIVVDVCESVLGKLFDSI